MASVTLKNIKKIYPNTGAETAKKKKRGKPEYKPGWARPKPKKNAAKGKGGKKR